jgi:hypothetical protein
MCHKMREREVERGRVENEEKNGLEKEMKNK